MKAEGIVILALLALLAAAAVLILRTRARLAAVRADLERMSVTDGLTGLFNRRHLFERFAEEFQEHRRQSMEMGCILVDLDRLRAVNATHGHATGDALLKEFARIVKASVRIYDVVGRSGGEEFIILLPLTGLLQSMAFAERVRRTIEQRLAVAGPSGETVLATISLGVTNLRAGDATVDAVAKRADEALLKAKESGRNRAELA